MKNYLVESMHGIGDQLYQRPFIQELATYGNVYIRSSLPWLYSDIQNVKFLRLNETYRTQEKDMKKHKVKYSTVPQKFTKLDPFYDGAKLKSGGSIISCIEDRTLLQAGIKRLPEYNMSLPLNVTKNDLKIKGLNSLDKIAVIRPATVRKEWICETRNPKQVYINWCTEVLKRSGYTTISIADLEDGAEWLAGPNPNADIQLHNGELGIAGVLNLISKAKIVIGGSGFAVPAAIAADTPMFVIFGGRGYYDAPSKIFDMRMDLRSYGWAVPDNFCRCTLPKHNCDKTVSGLEDIFMTYIRQLQQNNRL